MRTRLFGSTFGKVGRIAFLLLVAVALTPVPLTGLTREVQAQEVPRGRTLFDLLFNRRADERMQPVEPRSQPRPRVRRQSGSVPSSPSFVEPQPPSAAATPAAEKNEDARVLLVIGDFMGGGLGEGLTATFAQDPTVRVVTRENGSSGFVRDDYYNWPAQIGTILDEVEPAAVAVMIGSNDRQQMAVDGTREAVRSDAWTAEYTKRVRSLAKAIRDRGLPLVWVGQPAFKPNSMSTDMIAFNDIYQSVAEEVGGEFVDIWDGFVDENGGFATVGPDINGQRVRLRGSDGINLTAAGKRKVAFYAERSLKKIFEGGASIASRNPSDTGTPTGPAPVLAPTQVVRTKPIALGDPALDGGAALLGANAPAQAPDLFGNPLAGGSVTATQAGRADDFSLRRPKVATPNRAETTTSIR